MSGLNKQMHTSYALLFITVNTFTNSKQKFNDPKLSVVNKAQLLLKVPVS